MRIMHICQFLGIGGLEQVLFSLIKEQISLGHEVELVVYDHDKRWVGKFKKELKIRIHDEYIKKNGYDFYLLKYFNNKIKQFDIIHTHDLNPALYLGVLKFFKPKIRLIHTTHGMEHISKYPKTKLYEFFLSLFYDIIVSVSPHISNFYQKMFLINKRKNYQIMNGIIYDKNIQECHDVRAQKKIKLFNEFGLDPTIKTGVYVARLTPLKNQMKLIELISKTPYQLIIIGPYDDRDYANKCIQFVKNSSTNNNQIKITQEREDINAILNICDFYISTSLHEGLPMTVLEAGINKTVCILSDIPGHEIFNKNEECVVLFDHNSNMTERIKYALKNKEKLNTSLFNQIENIYSSKIMTKKYIELYESLNAKILVK